MGVLTELAIGYEEGIKLAEKAKAGNYECLESHIFDHDDSHNSIVCGDNLEYMKCLLENGFAGKIRLIYIDPPFFTKAKYDAVVSIKDDDGKAHKIKHLAYDDTFDRSLESYITNMTARLILMKELLANDGLIWVHLDWHSSHYIKTLMDEVFGAKNFQNEIIWKYKSGGSGKRHFSRKHDTILVYSKSSKYYLNVPQEKSYNRGLKPYRFKGVKEYKDDYGWYTMVNMKDVWSIDMVGRTSKERNGYATQKPLELMKRIIESSTEPGDYCADFFCGSGSFLEAANMLGRRWIGADNEKLAVSTARRRLDDSNASFTYMADQESEFEVGRANVKLTNSEELENGKKLLFYSITDFEPVIEYGYISNKDKDIVSEIYDSNPMNFIDYVMIDPDNDGPFKAEISVHENFDDIKFISHGNPKFVIVDVFGKEYITR